MKINYYDIGLNLFCRQFPDPQRILDDAAKNGVGCILTGTDTRENKKIHEYLKANDAFMALSLPAGKYNVQFKYCTPYLIPGMITTIFSLCILCGMYLRDKRQKE